MVGREMKEKSHWDLLPYTSNWNKNRTWQDSAESCQKNKCSSFRAGLNCSEFCDCQQCDDQSRMHMEDNDIEDENNDSETCTEDE